MSTYPPDGWEMVTGTWDTDAQIYTSVSWMGGQSIQLKATAVATEMQTADYYPCISSTFHTIDFVMTAPSTSNPTVSVYVDWYNAAYSLISTDTVYNAAPAVVGVLHYGKVIKSPTSSAWFKLRAKKNSSANDFRLALLEASTVGPYLHVYASSNHSIAATTWTDVQFNTEVDKSGNLLAYNTGTYTMTVNKPGVFSFTGAIACGSLDDGSVYTIGIVVNGTRYELAQTYTGAAGVLTHPISHCRRLDYGDTVKFQAYHGTGGGGVTVKGGSTTSWMVAAMVSPK